LKHIILVDNDPGIQDAASIILERAGYRVEVHADGEKILHGNYELPDMFILDNQLTGVSGVDICRLLKNGEQSRAVPVILLSASLHVAGLAAAAGADAYLEKPFNIKELRAIVEKHLQP
jgi:DNA-binding response OmpR family regulator